MTEDSNINFNNIFNNSHNLTSLQPVLNNMGPLQPVTLEGMVAHFSKAIEPMFIRLTNEVTSLRHEINVLRNEVKELKKEKSLVELLMPESPFKNIDEFMDFEKKLQEDKKFLNMFGKELLTVAKTPNFTKNCWRKLLVDELAQKMCWKGTEEKKSVRSLSSAKAIRNAAISIGLSEDEYIKSTKSFFQFAKNRQESKQKYTPKTKNKN
ncbi:uncharacterized protein LOC131803152 isoform X2 [Musca domestica]|nr:uncharacterized protein LOC131801373 isoform X2 [Musca domestica]XP_058980221.1 uncharacterized protein LOC131803152 isoform X2 [Musca domestica]